MLKHLPILSLVVGPIFSWGEQKHEIYENIRKLDHLQIKDGGLSHVSNWLGPINLNISTFYSIISFKFSWAKQSDDWSIRFTKKKPPSSEASEVPFLPWFHLGNSRGDVYTCSGCLFFDYIFIVIHTFKKWTIRTKTHGFQTFIFIFMVCVFLVVF